MNQAVAHVSDLTPLNFGMLLLPLVGQVSTCLAENFKAPNNGILHHWLLPQLVEAEAIHVALNRLDTV